MADLSDPDAKLAAAVLAGKRRALAKAITLVESTRVDHEQRAGKLLESLLQHTGRTIRIGISGAPGVGKSTFIEALGMQLITQGKRVAVLAIDPSSAQSGGSILGDKTRMERLSLCEEAFIRPTPTGGKLGGVAAKTREALLVCEAAGFDVIIVETVGVGQSETAVAGMTDVFVLLQLPNAGDELQAIKKGIVELADIVVVNKADIDSRAADVAAGQIKGALSMLRPSSNSWQPQVLRVSALKSQGIEGFWKLIMDYRKTMDETGEFELKRRHQALNWMWMLIESGLSSRFRSHPAVHEALPEVTRAVEKGAISPAAAAQQLLEYSKSKS